MIILGYALFLFALLLAGHFRQEANRYKRAWQFERNSKIAFHLLAIGMAVTSVLLLKNKK